MKETILNFLQKRYQMVIATYDDVNPWATTVYYVCDKDLNIYFYSYTETIHMQHILKNHLVSISVADSPQPKSGKRLAVQLWGSVERINDKEKIKWFLENWTDNLHKYPVDELAISEEKGVYRISPRQIKYFDNEINHNMGYKFDLEF